MHVLCLSNDGSPLHQQCCHRSRIYGHDPKCMCTDRWLVRELYQMLGLTLSGKAVWLAFVAGTWCGRRQVVSNMTPRLGCTDSKANSVPRLKKEVPHLGMCLGAASCQPFRDFLCALQNHATQTENATNEAFSLTKNDEKHNWYLQVVKAQGSQKRYS